LYEQGRGMRELQFAGIKIMRLTESWVIYGRFTGILRVDL
jgi:hypothetical protein